MQDANDWMQGPEESEPAEVDPGFYALPPTASFDPIVQDALAGVGEINELVDEVIAGLPDHTPTDGPFADLPHGVPGGSGTEELVGFINDGNTDVTGLINDFLNGDLSGPGDASTGPSPVAPQLPGLPEPQLPVDVTPRDPIIHPEEFTLNGFPFQGQDPTEPGYYSLPSY
jgi:hypothetical protein